MLFCNRTQELTSPLQLYNLELTDQSFLALLFLSFQKLLLNYQPSRGRKLGGFIFMYTSWYFLNHSHFILGGKSYTLLTLQCYRITLLISITSVDRDENAW